MIEVQNLGKFYRADNGAIPALENLSFSVATGEFISIIGPSGCGKSTLLKLIGNLIEPTLGSISIDGKSSRQARLDRMFSFVFQKPVLLPWRRVIDNVRLPLEILHCQGRDPYQLLQLVGLEGTERQYPYQLSGGMQQRVALARALTFDPKVLLMDEPFAAVDELNRDSLNLELLRIWREIGVTVLFVTHSISEALFLADRVLVLTSRPAKIDYILNVPFSRSRELSLKETKEFQEIVKCLREKLE
jgi:NitT/TauT family transport system ATP-binding protein